ncbi:acyl carrier protein [Streptomyces sp. URMC 127]|uniref:acyl carrier protein n=1 Tax=Streptomyces sp. URMC 127 TaxID=3423402 RepID=UPI003F1B112F
MQLTCEAVIEALAKGTGMREEELTPETRLADVELDSLMLAEFATVLAAEHGVRVAEVIDPTEATTIGDIVTAVVEQARAGGPRTDAAPQETTSSVAPPGSAR